MIPRRESNSVNSYFRLFTSVLACFMALPNVAKCAETQTLPMVAIVPLEGRKVDSLDARTLTDALADQLLKTKEVRVMERSQMDAILNEQGFQQSGACDGQECAVQIGKLLGIDRIVVGSVAAFGKAYTIAVREVDVKTGEVLVTASRNWKGDFENLLTDIVPMVAKELAHPEVPKQLVEKTAPPVVPPPPSVAVSTPTTSEKPVSVESKQSSGSWKWWLTGGVLVASGTTAAILLLNNDSKTSTSTTQNSDVTVRWAQ